MPVVLWDLDGTLVDSRVDLAEAGNAAREACGLPALPVAEVAQHVGDGLRRLLGRLLPDANEAQLDEARHAFHARYAQCRSRTTRPYAGIVVVLHQLREAGWTQAVVTNKPLEHSLGILRDLDLLPYFGAVEGGDGPCKPAPDQLWRALATLGGEPAQAWMLGDHRTDLAAGRAAGTRCCHCAWGFGQRDGQPCDAVAHHPAHLPQLLGLSLRVG